MSKMPDRIWLNESTHLIVSEEPVPPYWKGTVGYTRNDLVPSIETCDVGHKYAKTKDHPRGVDGNSRCPHCMAIGLDIFTKQKIVDSDLNRRS